MTQQLRARIVAVGTALPERILTNTELEQMVDTSAEWIRTRTGIVERRIAAPGTPLSALAVPACQQALARAGVAADEVHGIIVATITGDCSMPCTANLVQAALGASEAFAFDLANACNGFISALASAAAFLESGRYRNILVVGGDIMSSVIDYEDRGTCILFGDGAGAVLMQAGPADGPGVHGYVMHSDGQFGDLLSIPASGSALPRSPESLAARQHFLQQDGPQVFQHAIRRMVEVALEMLERLGLSSEDVDLLVPHQANLRIIESTARRLDMPMQRVVVNLDRVANTTAATIPLALAEAEADGRLRPGSRVLLVAFGGGFSWGASYLTWG